MDEMISYIFGSLKSSEASIKNINNALKHQKRVNGNFVCLAIAGIFYISAQAVVIKKHDDEIRRLQKEIKGLKDEKGE